jgi:septin family protein
MKEMDDTRVHLMLYFFGSSHRASAVDYTILQKFQKIVNIIPIIARGDSFESKELLNYKMNIQTSAIDRGVQFYDCFQAIEDIARVRKTLLIIHIIGQ